MNRLISLADSTERLRHELREMHGALADLTAQIGAVELQAEQVAALRLADREAAARMETLEHALDRERVATHLRQVVKRTELVDAAVPHAFLSSVLPSDVYEAAVDAIPSHIFFESRGGRQELPLPPTLAPTHVIVTWMFLADMLTDVFAPAVIERCEEPFNRHLRTVYPSVSGLRDASVALDVVRGRLVLQHPGDVTSVDRGGPWDWLTIVLYLESSRANTALMFFSSTAAREPFTLPHTGPAETEGYACEFRIGPDKKTRRRWPAAAADEQTR